MKPQRAALILALAFLLPGAPAQEPEPSIADRPAQPPAGAPAGGATDGFVEDVRVLHEFRAESPDEQFGWVARRIGDVDGDGVTDFATSSPTRVAGGRVFVYSSKSGKLLFHRDGEPGQWYGQGVAPAGDVDGDSVPDLVVGAPAGGKGVGRAHVLSGRDGRLLRELLSGETGDNFGMKVCGIEDLDEDGVPEIVVGATLCDAAAVDAGRVWVFSGKSGKILFTREGEVAGEKLGSAVDATRAGKHRMLVVGAMGYQGKGRVRVYRCRADGADQAFTIDADEKGATLGMYFVTVMGDADDDGTPDVFASDFGDSSSAPQAGRIYVHSGATGKKLLDLKGHRPREAFGTSVSNADDVDGDGRADLIVGAWQNAEGAPSGGKCYLYSSQGKLLATYTGTQAGDTLGFDAQGLGDVDGDGAIDFILTAAWSKVAGRRSGRIFIVAGSVKPE